MKPQFSDSHVYCEVKEKGKKKKSKTGEIFGKNARYYREKQKKTQKEIAFAAEISPTYYSEVENNLKEPSLDIANRISKSLNIDLGKLVTELKEK